MIEFKTGNMLAERVEALVNTVNCVGVMGRGIALQFKKAYPINFKEYAAACKREEVQPGQMFTIQVSRLTDPKYIVNFPTKRHWKGKSRIEDIEAGLQSLVLEIERLGIQSIAVPPLGCGLGGLDWQEVKPLIETYLGSLPHTRIVVFEPNTALAAKDINPSKDVPKMTTGRAALVGLINRYLRGLLDPIITLIEVQKLIYFMQEAGPSSKKLEFAKGHYGPYAKSLSHVLHAIEGHFVSGYADGGDTPDKELGLVPGAVKDAEMFLKDYPETIEKFDRITNLIDGFETPFGLELLATVHWIVVKEQVTSIDEVIQAVYNWNNRKKQFSERQIRLAYETLQNKGWLTGNSDS